MQEAASKKLEIHQSPIQSVSAHFAAFPGPTIRMNFAVFWRSWTSVIHCGHDRKLLPDVPSLDVRHLCGRFRQDIKGGVATEGVDRIGLGPSHLSLTVLEWLHCCFMWLVHVCHDLAMQNCMKPSKTSVSRFWYICKGSLTQRRQWKLKPVHPVWLSNWTWQSSHWSASPMQWICCRRTLQNANSSKGINKYTGAQSHKQF